MEQVYLSDTELYYVSPGNMTDTQILLTDEEVHHITKVMRHKEGDNIHITSGEGKIWLCEIAGIEKKKTLCTIKETFTYKNEFSNFTFCLPLMKSNDRLEFAVEKLVELGITGFIIYSSVKGSSRGAKLHRLEKISTAAMKQSLRAFLPEFEYIDDLTGIFKNEGVKLVFEQSAENSLADFIHSELKSDTKYFFIIGPEAGFSEREEALFTDVTKLKLTKNRLRTETAAISAGVLLSNQV